MPYRNPGHIVVVGCTTTVVRLVEELQRADEQVAVVVPGTPEGWVLDDLTAVAHRMVKARVVREVALRDAGVERAKAVVILGQNDVEAMRLALLVEELNPAARLVIEMRRSAISTKLNDLLGQCIVLSTAQLAAPSFVAAALADDDVTSFEIAGRSLVAGHQSRVGGQLLGVLGDANAAGSDGLLGLRGDIVLGTEVVGSGPRRVRQSGFIGAIAHVIDLRMRVVLLVLLGLIIASTLFFHYVGDLDWLMSIYAALTASTLTGIGEIGDLSLPARFGAVMIQLAGLVLSSGITAVIVDALISARLSALTGGVRGRPHDHVIVCGLGRVGSIVAVRLQERGIPVVAIEQNEAVAGVRETRQARIPVVIASATDQSALRTAGIEKARAILAVTDADAANLEISMVAKDLCPSVHVVTRLFDHELARRVEGRLDMGATRSVSMVAAPIVAAAATGRRLEHIVSVGRRVVVLSEVTIDRGAEAEGMIPQALVEANHVQVLAVRRGNGPWDWSVPRVRLDAGDRVAVAASRLGFARLLTRVRTHETGRLRRP